MRRLRKFLQLSPADQWLLLRALALLAAIRLGLCLFSFPRMCRLLLTDRQAPPRRHTADPSLPQRIARSIAVASRYVPSATCLTQALSTKRLLAANGCPGVLKVGVAKGPAGTLKSHAWIECDGRILLGEVGDFHTYRVLVALDGTPPLFRDAIDERHLRNRQSGRAAC